jgi:WD40 repeat protein
MGSSKSPATAIGRTLLTALVGALSGSTLVHGQLPPADTGGFFVSDYNNDRVAVYDPTGGFLRTFTAAGLNGPRGIVAMQEGTLYVASQLTNSIFVLDGDEQYVTQFDASGLSGPTGMALSPSGDELYVSSYGTGRVYVFDLDGVFLRWFTAPGFANPNCVAFDSQGSIYAASASTGLVFKFDANEQFLSSFTAPGPPNLVSPMGIAIDGSDVLFVAGGASHNIVRFQTDGTYLGVITHPDLTGPQGVAFDDREHLWSSSFYQDKLVELLSDGTHVQTITAGGLDIPRSIAFAHAELGGPFCDASDGSLAACPCGNPGKPDSGCDIQQATGGVSLQVTGQQTSPTNRSTLTGSDFPLASSPAAIVIRALGLDSASPVVFGDGLRCIGVPVVRLGATFATAGTSTHTIGHGAMAGSGTFYYQLWFRNTPIMYCDPTAAFNLSNGRSLDW